MVIVHIKMAVWKAFRFMIKSIVSRDICITLQGFKYRPAIVIVDRFNHLWDQKWHIYSASIFLSFFLIYAIHCTIKSSRNQWNLLGSTPPAVWGGAVPKKRLNTGCVCLLWGADITPDNKKLPTSRVNNIFVLRCCSGTIHLLRPSERLR